MSTTTKPRGRPRSVQADRAILDATLAIAREVGLNSLSMDGVADRAGVSKATIYRRWSSKEAMMVDALSQAINPLADADLGSLEADLRDYLGRLAERMATGKMSGVLPHLVDVAVHNPELRASLDTYIESRGQPVLTILQRAHARGELRAGIDIEVVVEATIGPCVYRRLLTDNELNQTFTDTLVDLILPGITPEA